MLASWDYLNVVVSSYFCFCHWNGSGNDVVLFLTLWLFTLWIWILLIEELSQDSQNLNLIVTSGGKMKFYLFNKVLLSFFGNCKYECFPIYLCHPEFIWHPSKCL